MICPKKIKRQIIFKEDKMRSSAMYLKGVPGENGREKKVLM